MMGLDMEIQIEMIVGAITGLVAAIVHLYTLQSKNFKKSLKKLDECERKHEEANEKIISLTEKVGRLSGAKDLHDNIVMIFNKNLNGGNND